MAKRRVGLQPVPVALDKQTILLAPEDLLLLGRENLLEKAEFSPQDRLIVNRVQAIEVFSEVLESVEPPPVRLGRRHSAQIQIDRMQREGGDRRIRVRVPPAMSGGRIVDGQDLNHLEPCLAAPVSQEPEVRKLAHAETGFAAETEHRDRHTCAFPGRAGQGGKPVVEDRQFVARPGIGQRPVFALLEANERLVCKVINPVLVIEGQPLRAEVQFHAEIILSRPAVQQHRFNPLPLAQGRNIAQKTHRLPPAQERRFDLENVGCLRWNRRPALDRLGLQKNLLERLGA